MVFLSACATLFGLGFLGWILLRRPLIGIAFFLMIFSFATRIFSIGVLDVFGPLYAVELFEEVGGTATVHAYVGAILLFLTPFFILLHPQRLRELVRPFPRLPQAGVSIGDVFCVVALAYVLILYADMLRIGVIPLFQGMERWEYTLLYAGPLHELLIEHGNLMCLQLGIFCAYPRLRGGRTDLRIALVFLSLFPYLLLTGNRFSAFFAFSSFFVVPFACLWFVPRSAALSGKPSLLARLIRSKLAVGAIAAVGFATVVFALWNSLLNVRGLEADLALFSLMQRILVQPGELFTLTYQRVFVEGNYNPLRAFEFMFENPIVPNRNSGIQYLMAEALGPQTAAGVIEGGTTYAGGFPEVIFELLGPVFSWPALLAIGWLTAWLLRTILLAIQAGCFLTAFTTSYVFYGLILLFVGGMLNFIIAWTFWVKILLMVTFFLVERVPTGHPTPLMRWTLWHRPAMRHRPLDHTA